MKREHIWIHYEQDALRYWKLCEGGYATPISVRQGQTISFHISNSRSYYDIHIFREAAKRELVKEIYRETSSVNFSRDFGLKDQVRRAAVSVISNIAEGFERGGNKEFIQFLYHAKGSCGEVRTQLYLAWDLDYLTDDTFQRLYELVRRTGEIISGLIRYLGKSEMKGNKFK